MNTNEINNLNETIAQALHQLKTEQGIGVINQRPVLRLAEKKPEGLLFSYWLHPALRPQHFLYFFPDPQGQGSLG